MTLEEYFDSLPLEKLLEMAKYTNIRDTPAGVDVVRFSPKELFSYLHKRGVQAWWTILIKNLKDGGSRKLICDDDGNVVGSCVTDRSSFFTSANAAREYIQQEYPGLEDYLEIALEFSIMTSVRYTKP